MAYTLDEIAKHIQAKLVTYDEDKSSANDAIESLATLANAKIGQVAFLANKKYISQLSNTKASAVIIAPDMLAQCPVNALVMDNPYMGYALLANLLDTTPKVASGIHTSAVIDESVHLGENVSIGANAVIESGVYLNDDVCIGAGCFIGKNSSIGKGTRLWANTSIYHNVIIGEDCLIQANTVIGSDGFGYAPVNANYKWHKIPQLGRVIIGNKVEIGASTTIDRGALEDTVIKDGVILDNQIQIAHNVVIGENTAMAACSVIAGSTVIGKNCTIAGLVGVNGHINITDNCVFTGMSMVTKSIVKPGVYSSGMPVVDNSEWHKINARVKRLDSLTQRVKALEKLLESK
ncbi:UDP-3-O-(3-hydroxymyristoyl)glucosamine N-acyltransferase [Colwellia sp. 4_MG-2023]|jgi:UDP-3-O-[3-hydroxymyristoyl] glucosamine N-acyltransferase|uniref:UDP-3-O-(3-hydroxymyristoyl)glucosamine N-acyltransferase n=1 Tax=unclassified Colwellia TaxID=196834 RepID=UPI001C09E80D|nr:MULTISPECIES: UDP-3-O-(3-hydroxymyristoyl)glucosamine N-acyltransferase [unclassified Colwellia]MBU2925689.1 UDP-3-O-(3-hydroxymyristoyl)glucosamine N-acyltransferase [Colwellia sp. C2M11]MDO6487828.1 UDP-3-O-(3-hydroxymyristoyl)glucosamine N-acyltransferase [Colwellia sp. 6_MG-2023]MDO6505664.1 UDP-3-O-(3-hydroxymyristoyl)glucosamine N-acyltransferase [Colwellia sp. 5_MG-2023]MDO6554040.1 UDP-3-O-(3-hydroxymyristoyl)glucosamine N-acyltransferase [Colwellia sp. 4_MG-2023]MDO6651085.1 UDP-3-